MINYKQQMPVSLFGGRQTLTDHIYDAPAERSDMYNRLLKENDPRAPDSFLEPEQGKLLYADVDFEYNYYAPEYENASYQLGYLSKHPQLLPSLNLFLTREATEKVSEWTHRDYYKNLFSISGMVRSFYTTAESPTQVLSMEYFLEFGTHASREYNSESEQSEKLIRQVLEKSEFIDKDAMKLYADIENKRELFPFFGKMALNGIPNSELANILEDYNLDQKFIDFLDMHRADNRAEIRYTKTYEDSREDIIAQTVNYTNIETFYQHIDESHSGDIYSFADDSTSACDYFESFLLGTIGRNKIRKYIENHPFGFSTPVAFRLEKKSSISGIISAHYFFNYQDVENFIYFDTQVGYRTEYEYDIKVYNAVVTQVDTHAGGKDLVFLEQPYYSDTFYVLDSPPIAPDVELITYRGVSDKLLILFNKMIDKKALVPVLINESDEKSFEEQRLAQKIPQPNPIVFESDDPTNFEIFKTTKLPSSYSDFANTMYRVVDSGGLSAASYTDTIVPNQVYYYMFRALDLHGFVSNPSPIYEFVLIKEGETMYPRIRIVDLAQPEPPTQKARIFKKYLKIGFSPSQVQIPPDEIQNIGDDLVGKKMAIGTSNDNLIGSDRTFKFRIKSKNTGKLIDINVTFKKNKVIRA